MSNNYFSFKQFTVKQENCAMKVCTDACLLGAWTANEISGKAITNMLDIGCGTGLLSLMLAQKINVSIDSIEINAEAVLQAAENFSSSPWPEHIHLIHSSLQDFIPQKKYDLIISNPPFYEDDLHSTDINKNAAKHDTTLTIGELICFVKDQLTEEGLCCLLIPFHRVSYVERNVQKNGLFVQKKLLLRQSYRHIHFRAILMISAKPELSTLITELVIHDNERQYTDSFKTLLKDYYLNL